MFEHEQRGNVLFLVLVAVVLFAGLSYAVTQGSRGNGNADRESNEIRIAERDNIVSSINSAKMRLMLVGGCDEIEISYETSDGSNNNPNAPIDKSCHIFDKGGVAAPPYSDGVLTPVDGDLDGDFDIDRADVAIVAGYRNGSDDMIYDFNNDGVINIGDSRALVLKCTKPVCAE